MITLNLPVNLLSVGLIVTVNDGIGFFCRSAMLTMQALIKYGIVIKGLIRFRQILFLVTCRFTATAAHTACHINQHTHPIGKPAEIRAEYLFCWSHGDGCTPRHTAG